MTSPRNKCTVSSTSLSIIYSYHWSNNHHSLAVSPGAKEVTQNQSGCLLLVSSLGLCFNKRRALPREGSPDTRGTWPIVGSGTILCSVLPGSRDVSIAESLVVKTNGASKRENCKRWKSILRWLFEPIGCLDEEFLAECWHSGCPFLVIVMNPSQDKSWWQTNWYKVVWKFK